MYEDSSKWFLWLKIAAAAALQTRSEKIICFKYFIEYQCRIRNSVQDTRQIFKFVQWGIIKKKYDTGNPVFGQFQPYQIYSRKANQIFFIK